MATQNKQFTAASTDSSVPKECRTQFDSLFRYAQIGVVITDGAGVYLDANEVACAMLGYSREEFIGKQSTDMIDVSEGALVEPALAEIRARCDHRRVWRFRRKDGSTLSAEVIATLARTLKKGPRLKNVPIIAVTAFAMAGDREKCLAAGAQGYIEKPINPESFTQEVEQFLPAPKKGLSE